MRYLALAVIASLLALALCFVFPAEKADVYVIANGAVSKGELEFASLVLEEEYGDWINVHLADQKFRDPESHDPNLRFHESFDTYQYKTESFFDIAPGYYHKFNADILIILTDKHIYPSEEFNYVFGQARMGEMRMAVLSTWYLKRTPDAMHVAEDSLFQQRLRKLVLHETGHTLGLFHHPNRECVMTYSASLPEFDKAGIKLCGQSKDTLNVTVPEFLCGKDCLIYTVAAFLQAFLLWSVLFFVFMFYTKRSKP